MTIRTIFFLLIMAAPVYADVSLIDKFGRELSTAGVTLVDWEGQIANPAIEIFILPPEGIVLPANVTLRANGGRIYFDLPSTVSSNGPVKVLDFQDGDAISVLISIYPDRDFDDETYVLTIEYIDPQQGPQETQISINVIDQDIGRPIDFPVSIDFGQDQSGFFSDQSERTIINQVAQDWAYFIADMKTAPVPQFAESTFIWNWPLAWTSPPYGEFVLNQSQYEGFQLYSYGVSTDEVRSGGAPSNCCFHVSSGSELPLRRSGSVEIEVKGNYNELGWSVDNTDATWLASTNLANESADLYSIAHHEFGHAFGFHSQYPEFAKLESNGVSNPAIVAYYGSPFTIDSAVDHLSGIIDPASRRGAFGNEYYGDVPSRRWLITKLDLLVLESIGYVLRPTSATNPLTVITDSLESGTPNIAYHDIIELNGGIAFYDSVVVDGHLPPGLSLNRFNGEISGTPTIGGSFSFVVSARDYSNTPEVQVSFQIQIDDPDADRDGFPDDQDAFPDDPSEWLDTDGDGIGNNADTDDDNDALTDVDEVSLHGTDPARADTDGDGLIDGDEIMLGLDPLDPDDCPHELCPPSSGLLKLIILLKEQGKI